MCNMCAKTTKTLRPNSPPEAYSSSVLPVLLSYGKKSLKRFTHMLIIVTRHVYTVSGFRPFRPEKERYWSVLRQR